VNVSNLKSKFQIQIYRYFNEDIDDQFIKGGSVVRLLHSERGGYLHSDDKDFTNDGIIEVYFWNFKGNQNDLEANSSFSLFEVEVAGPLINSQGKKVAEKGNDSDPMLHASSDFDFDSRKGRVFTYSTMGGLA
jgi:hypothetical protein